MKSKNEIITRIAELQRDKARCDELAATVSITDIERRLYQTWVREVSILINELNWVLDEG